MFKIFSTYIYFCGFYGDFQFDYVKILFFYLFYFIQFFSSSKCSLFHNSNVFGPCIIHILYTECAKIK